MPHAPLSRITLARARQLRREATPAERRLWAVLRARNVGGWRFRRQHPTDDYILDFYCPAARLAVELDGTQHGLDEARRHDEERTRGLAQRGIRVLRFTNDDVMERLDSVVAIIASSCATPR